MNNTYTTVSVIYSSLLIHQECQIGPLSIHNFGCLGVEEYSYGEEQVDELLGERSYSGGDLTPDIYEELEGDARLKNSPIVNFYFDDKAVASKFSDWLKSLKINLDFKQVEKPIEDWNAFWREHYDIIELGGGFRIVPSWKKESPLNKSDINIYPGMGFGTGNHETTYLCLKALLDHELSLARVLDFGCGSGILGIGAIKKDKNSAVDFYDIDDEAILNCDENIELNDLIKGDYLRLLPQDRNKLTSYSLVFANILKHVLEAECEAIVSYVEPRGHLILSGLLKEQTTSIVKLYSEYGFKLIEEYVQGDWAALLMIKESK